MLKEVWANDVVTHSFLNTDDIGVQKLQVLFVLEVLRHPFVFVCKLGEGFFTACHVFVRFSD